MSRFALRSGNAMVAEGAVAAGCRFFSGYPITPASEVYQAMTDRLARRGDLAIGAPDEITALCYCVGASQRGVKAMTATSGPGWCLMTETMQYALMTETPVVIVLVQRLGPCTGGATQGGQGDVLLAEFATSGAYTVPVFAPSDAVECYDLTIHAFNWAERLRTPVVLLSDKEVGMTTESVDLAGLADVPIAVRPTFDPASAVPYVTYAIDDLADVPAFAPVGGPNKVTVTGSAHNMAGMLKKNDPETLQLLTHLQRKIEARAAEMAITRADLEPGAETLILSFGITARTAREAVRLARARGTKVSFLQVMTLFPIPERDIARCLDGTRRVVVPEENLTGQYRGVVRPLFGDREVVGVNKIGGMITPEEILSAVEA